MALTLGAHHVLGATGQLAIAQPVGLVVSVSGIPSYVARDSALPTLYHRIGWLNLGHALGWQPQIDLVHVPQLVYPLAPEFTILQVNLLAGESATVDEIASASSSRALMQPWDRTPQVWTQNAVNTAVGATSNTTAWTYTVPAGKKLMLAHADVHCVRAAVASVANAVALIISVAGSTIAQASLLANTVGATAADSLSAGALYLPSGTVIAATYFNLDTGGSVYVYLLAAGLLFDA